MQYQRILLGIVIGWYLLLSLGHYVDQRPLWNDERCVLNNIVTLKPSELFTRPLINDQAFPRVYLWTIQQFSKPFHQHLLALRFFSFLAMMGAFAVWFGIARRVLGDGWELIFFVGAWCASMPLVYYAAELKPYSMDVLVSGVIVLFLINRQQNAKCFQRILFFLPWLALWSYPAIFLLFLPLYQLIRECIEQRRWLPDLSIYLGSYVVVLGLIYQFDFRVSTHSLLEVFWHDYFISVDSAKHFFSSFGKGMNNLIGRPFAESPRWVKIPSRIFISLGLAYMLLAGWNRWKKDRFSLNSVVSIAFVMFFIQLVLAVLRIYPFAVPRMSLFFTPLLLLMTIKAISAIYQQRKPLGMILGVIFAGYLVFVSLGIAWNVFLKGNLGAESTLYEQQVSLS